MDYMDRQDIRMAKNEEFREQQAEKDLQVSLEERKVKALERIAESLAKLTLCVNIGRDGLPCLQVTDTYQEWRSNLD